MPVTARRAPNTQQLIDGGRAHQRPPVLLLHTNSPFTHLRVYPCHQEQARVSIALAHALDSRMTSVRREPWKESQGLACIYTIFQHSLWEYGDLSTEARHMRILRDSG